MNFGFIIPICIREQIHLNQLKRCIESIRKYHKNIKIILIDDSDAIYINQIEEIFKQDINIFIRESLNKGSADQQTFKVLLETKLFNKAVILQDSMILNKKLENIDKINIQFIWYFTNHIVHWDIIKEPKTEYNLNNNIYTHSDLIQHNILRDYKDNESFQKYVINKLENKKEWCGCFGSLCIIDKKSLSFLNNNVNFINKFIYSASNRDRRVNESIFALICHYSFPKINFKNSYDGLYYDGDNHGGNINLINKPTGFDDLTWCAVHDFFSKVSFNR